MSEDLPEIPETHFVVNDKNELVLVEEEQEGKVKRPPMYNVILLNDDYTPMDFVVELLMQVFGHSESAAVELMSAVHEKGEAVVATYSYDIAESRVAHVNKIAQNNSFPLKATMRPES